MAGLFEKIKKRAGIKGKSEAELAEEEMKEAKPAKKRATKKAEEAKPVEVVNKEGEQTKVVAEKKKKQIFTNAHRILLRSVVSEKASIAESINTYTFMVSNTATKVEIARAVNQVYGVKPTNVHIINKLGKSLRTRNGITKRSDWKKALVTLPAGQTIGIHEGV